MVPKRRDPLHYRRFQRTTKLRSSAICRGRQAVRPLEAPLTTIAVAGQVPAAIDLNQPGTYLNWNIFTISVANLVLIAVMVAIFGAALLLPFPGRRHQGEAAQA